ncbi:MAG: hypothetical protein H6573_29515 [Lewinellaceae bacterium]|nr:hypothetical protein [Phaeodactylibacter sp.]MCB9351608.1 hypothetical protein [Lewinellaceae bacterium]
MKKDNSIAIIGGGIGGLTTGIALHRQGFRPAIIFLNKPLNIVNLREASLKP